MEKYQEIYNEFIEKYNRVEVTPSNVGEIIARLAGIYPNYNMTMTKAERAFALVSRDEVLKTDEATGKVVSATKAETIAQASIEATAYKNARAHVQNIEMLIGSLKFLQKSLEVEFLNSNI